MTRSNRIRGRILHLGPSRTCGYWAVLRDADGVRYFAYGKSFLAHPARPRVGWNCEFTPLPRGPGKMKRATEVAVLKPTSRKAEICLVHKGGSLRVILRDGKRAMTLGRIAHDICRNKEVSRL